MPQGVRIANRTASPGRDRGLSALLVAAGWVIQQLPDRVVEDQREALVQALAEARPLIIEISPPTGVRVLSGDRLLLDLPAETAAQRTRGIGKWSRAD